MTLSLVLFILLGHMERKGGPLSIRAIPVEAKYDDVVVCIRLFNRLGRKKENRKVKGKMNL